MVKFLCTALSTAGRAGSRRPMLRGFLEVLCNNLSSGFDARQWTLRTGGLLLLLVWLPAQAADYTFPGSLPPGCTGPVNNVYDCASLTLNASDTITIGGNTEIAVTGNLAASNFVEINSSGTSNLIITVTGRTDLGATSILKGNVTGTNTIDSTITIGANSQVVGNLTTTTAGAIVLGANSDVIGDLSTKSGAINVGSGSEVTGSISSSLAGAINIGNNSDVSGDLSTESGAINVGNSSTVNGSISSSLAGVITIGNNSVVGGDLRTKSGAINVGNSSTVNGSISSSLAGVITIGVFSNVGDLTTLSGAINVGGGSTVTGSIVSTLAGAVTISSSSTSQATLVTGSVRTDAGAITVEADVNVNGNVSTNDGAITIGARATVGGLQLQVQHSV